MNMFYILGESEVVAELFPNIGVMLSVHIFLLYYDFDLFPSIEWYYTTGQKNKIQGAFPETCSNKKHYPNIAHDVFILKNDPNIAMMS